MSFSTVLGVVPDRRPVALAEFRNSHGWAPSIWRRLLAEHGEPVDWFLNDAGLTRLWQAIESLPEWQQVPLVLTFDTGVIPFQEFERAAYHLEQFDRLLPAPVHHVNHVRDMVELLRTNPEVPLIGVWGTSVTDNPFDPWDDEADDYGSGIPASEMYMLERHRHHMHPGGPR